jgi:hypothetical protein
MCHWLSLNNGIPHATATGVNSNRVTVFPVRFVSRCYKQDKFGWAWAYNWATKFKLIYDRQSVGQSVLVPRTHLGPVTNFFSLIEIFF